MKRKTSRKIISFCLLAFFALLIAAAVLFNTKNNQQISGEHPSDNAAIELEAINPENQKGTTAYPVYEQPSERRETEWEDISPEVHIIQPDEIDDPQYYFIDGQ